MIEGLFILGLVILVGFVGHLLYKTTKIPESVFLIIMGVLFGPVFGVVNGQFFLDNASFFLSFALVLVLLNSGLSIDVEKTLKNAPLAFLFTLLVLVITTGIVTLVTTKLFGWPIINGIFLGVLGFGTELIAISDMMEKLRLGGNTKTLLILESVINDVFLIISISILLAITANTGIPLLRVVMNMFFLSILLGILFAVTWIYLFVRHIHGNPLGYVFTLGAALVIYVAMDYFGFNGAICVLVFSIGLGNYRHFLKWFKNADKLIPVEKDIIMVGGVNNQLTFLIRTLFFFFIGLIFDLSTISKELLFFVLLLTFMLVASRFLAGWVLSLIQPKFKESIPILTVMAASGFVDTLLAIMVARAGIAIPHLTEIILMVVIFTTVISVISVIAVGRHYANNRTY